MSWQKHFGLSFDTKVAFACNDKGLEVGTDFCATYAHD